MNRVEFTEKAVILLLLMILAGERPIIDYVKRSTEEQKRLYKKGLSKCDGVKKKSKHQYGKAIDIYLINEKGRIIWNKEKYRFWHSVWKHILGGKEMIEWDIAHFE
ncbi:MAG: hypothetical protein DRP09_15355 [Candidatus Thorarchaeota archaeon]|nr:MAG: hypothetical protein DRP09_15355 [Candidatus Thorarchaeota archaeon]